MRLNEYSKFLKDFCPAYQQTFHYAVITDRYYHLAEVQAEAFNNAINSAFFPKSNTESNEKRYSFGYGVYVMLRTCLESLRKLNIYFDQQYNDKKLSTYRKEWCIIIRPIIDVANHLIKHPLGDPKRDKGRCYEPGGSDNKGALTVYGYSTNINGDMVLLKIIPVKDLKVVYDYIEGIAKIYRRIVRH